ncbi:hypothetical protein [Bacillus thuringiensis]|uniref:hypothetical protein n=1 Tax=Bacillus thuringiensis TaxID=1428 RepID=UPI0005CE9A85|nr:hypothetical protein [Bacillus thuringiensis]
MERENIIDATKEHLKQFNLGDLSLYKESTREQLITIERYFLETEELINKTLKEINSVNFNIRGICKAINISKSTVYNNPNTLRLYIEKRIEDIEKQDLLSKNKQRKTQERMSELENFIDKSIIDQIEFNNLKVNNEYLQAEVHRLAEKNQLLGLERAELVKKINDMEVELRLLRNTKGTVVTFK